MNSQKNFLTQYSTGMMSFLRRTKRKLIRTRSQVVAKCLSKIINVQKMSMKVKHAHFFQRKLIVLMDFGMKQPCLTDPQHPCVFQKVIIQKVTKLTRNFLELEPMMLGTINISHKFSKISSIIEQPSVIPVQIWPKVQIPCALPKTLC